MAVNASDAIGWGLVRAGMVGFRVGAWRRWMGMGVVAWLAGVSEYGALGYLTDAWAVKAWGGLSDVERAADYFAAHEAAVMGWMIGVVVVLFAVYVAFRWVNCRGEFMLLECVVRNKAAGRESWRRHRRLGNSLLKFRIMWDLAIFNVFLVVFAAAGVLAWQDVRAVMDGADFAATGWTWAAGIVLGVGMVAALVGVSLANLFLHYWMVPVMYLRGMGAKEAFRVSRREMLWRWKKAGAGFLLILFLASSIHRTVLLAGMVVSVVGVMVSLVPGLAVAATYPGEVAGLPVEIFMRAYGLRFVEQFGAEYAVGWEGAAEGHGVSR